MMKKLIFLPLIALAACTTTTTVDESDPQDMFFAGLKTMCGKVFAGHLETSDPVDKDFADKQLKLFGGPCSDTEIRIAFHVGEDASRTWIITRTRYGLRLKHRHLLKDGSVDPVSNYGGDTMDIGTALRQEFPVDHESKDMFTREGRTVSLTNVWALEINLDRSFTYELSRPNRLFRVTFDLSRPLSAMPGKS